jgi:hypothetical protein
VKTLRLVTSSIFGRGTTFYTFPAKYEHVIIFGYGFRYYSIDMQTDTWFCELVANDRRY